MRKLLSNLLLLTVAVPLVSLPLSSAPAPAAVPQVKKASAEELRILMRDLQQSHGARYPHAAAHLEELERLPRAGDPERLASLQREVLLFDVARLVAIQRHEIDASHVYTYHNEGFRAGGGLHVIDLNSASAGRAPQLQPIVASPDGQILDCDLSFDGKTVLFSWRQRADEGYHLWRVDIDGSGLKQLTRGEWHDYNGCWLPDGGIAFVSTRNAQFAYCWNSPVGVVHRMAADGSQVQGQSVTVVPNDPSERPPPAARA